MAPRWDERKGTAAIIIGGQKFEHFLSLNLTNSRDEKTCHGTIVLSWPGVEHLNVNPVQALTFNQFTAGAEGQILLDDQLAATIILDTRVSKGSPKSYELTLTFRGASKQINDNTVQSDTGQFNNMNPGQLAQQLAQGTGVDIIDKTGLGNMIKRFVSIPGETVERAISRATREFGVLAWENPQGKLVLETQNNLSVVPNGDIVCGKNLFHWSTKHDLGPRTNVLENIANGIPDQNNYGENNENLNDKGEYQTGGKNGFVSVPRESDHTQQTLNLARLNEGARRSGQGLNVTARMATHSDDGGRLWTLGNKYMTIIPVDGVNCPMELRAVEFEITPDSRSATLTLVADQVSGGSLSNVLFDASKQVKDGAQAEQLRQKAEEQKTLEEKAKQEGQVNKDPPEQQNQNLVPFSTLGGDPSTWDRNRGS